MEKTKLLWFVFLSSIGIYGVLPLVISPVAEEPTPMIAFALFGAAAMSALMSFVMPSLIERGAGDNRPEGFELTLCIVRWALAEAIAIFGLVLFLLGHGAIYAWGFAIAAGVLMIVHAPGQRTPAMQSSHELARPDVKIG